MEATNWPALPGTYALVFNVLEAGQLEVGRLGRHHLPAGRYVYAGSALGPGGLAGRLGRHLRSGRRTHWHVDYLAACWPVIAIVARPSPGRQECAWTRRLLALPGAAVPVPGFGSSDCREGCPVHLIRLPDDFDHAALRIILDAVAEAADGICGC